MIYINPPPRIETTVSLDKKEKVFDNRRKGKKNEFSNIFKQVIKERKGK